ncbi:MAG: hypothetical protein DME00_26205 [Candidatus Rokuibacteriota bacterium]|nr:MAG: hypothetical protein DME00_26205 [Candidatus Rokubacteria bacterium]
MCRLSFVICLLSLWLAPSFASAQRIVAETFTIPASDPGIQLHVRNKWLEGHDSFSAERIVLFVHGATYPSETVFDINLPGGSWVEYVARSGYDVYFVDVRGYGRSTRPTAMDAPATENPPFATTADAVKDVGSAVDFILKRRNISKLNLIGWSWGTAIMVAPASCVSCCRRDGVLRLGSSSASSSGGRSRCGARSGARATLDLLLPLTPSYLVRDSEGVVGSQAGTAAPGDAALREGQRAADAGR